MVIEVSRKLPGVRFIGHRNPGKSLEFDIVGSNRYYLPSAPLRVALTFRRFMVFGVTCR